jgi:hypothetical protein
MSWWSTPCTSTSSEDHASSIGNARNGAPAAPLLFDALQHIASFWRFICCQSTTSRTPPLAGTNSSVDKRLPKISNTRNECTRLSCGVSRDVSCAFRRSLDGARLGVRPHNRMQPKHDDANQYQPTTGRPGRWRCSGTVCIAATCAAASRTLAVYCGRSRWSHCGGAQPAPRHRAR